MSVFQTLSAGNAGQAEAPGTGVEARAGPAPSPTNGIKAAITAARAGTPTRPRPDRPPPGPPRIRLMRNSFGSSRRRAEGISKRAPPTRDLESFVDGDLRRRH